MSGSHQQLLMLGGGSDTAGLVYLPSYTYVASEDITGTGYNTGAYFGLGSTGAARAYYYTMYKGNTAAAQYISGTWRLSGASADYEVYAELVSGTLTSGSDSTDTWLAMSSARQWHVEKTTAGLFTVVLLLSFRRASDEVVIFDELAQVELYVENSI